MLTYANYLDLLLFFLIYIYIFFSISGFGLFFNKYILRNKVYNNFEFFFLGLPVIFILSFYYSIFFKYNIYFNLVFSLFGFFFSLFFLNEKILKFILLLIFFFGLIISQTHDDFGAYHYQYFKELVEGGPTLGLPHLASRYFYASSLTYIQSIFYLPFFSYNLFFVPIYLIYICLIGYLIFELKKTKNLNYSLIFLIILSVLLIKYYRFREHGYDYLVHCLIFFIFCQYLKFNKIDFFYITIFYLLILSNKLTGIIFLPLILFITNYQNIERIFLVRKILFLFFFLLSIFLNSFLKTGCIHFASEFSCPQLDVSWMVSYDEIIKIEKQFSIDWARGLYHGKKEIIPGSLGLFSKEWVPNWYVIHFKPKILDFLLIIIILVLLSIFFIFKAKLFINLKFIKILLSIFLCFILWFFLFPSVRFAHSIMVLFVIYFFLLFFKIKYLKKKILYIFIFFLVIYFNYRNLNRIYVEIKTIGFYKFDSFPYFKLPDRKYKIIRVDDNLEYYVPEDLSPDGSGKTCWNIKTPCKEDFSIQGKKNYEPHINYYNNYRIISEKKNNH